MDKKKMAAIMSAVTSYIESEEAAAFQQAASPQPMPSAPNMVTNIIKEQAVPLNIWGINGRQTQMQMRHLMQTKALHR